MSDDNHPSRRDIAVFGAGVLAATLGGRLMGLPDGDHAYAADTNAPTKGAMPDPVPQVEATAELPGTKLFYWDTGGPGQAIVLLHPGTGSARIWGHQQPAFANAGYRVIGYSRRGHLGSAPADRENGGHHSEDLRHLLDLIKVESAHLIGSAAGCSVVLDFALSYPKRVRSIVFSSGAFGTLADNEADYKAMTRNLRVKGLDEMPAEFREVGPAYRAVNPEGTKAWADLEHNALSGNRIGPTIVNRFTYDALARMTAPTLLIAGAADLMAPPPVHRLVASHLPNAQLVVVPESGHSIYWENPTAFNDTVLSFVSKHAG